MTEPDTHVPTGIEAQVCADIARRQWLGMAKYGTTVADNPLTLAAWLRHAYEEALDMAVYLRRAIAQVQVDASAQAAPSIAPPSAAPAPAKARRKGSTSGRYTYLGQPASIQQLADKAGCSWGTMQQRLRTRSPEAAVAMGAPGDVGVHRAAHTTAATNARMATAKLHPYKGQQLTARQLAALAGCTTKQMHLRLRNNEPARAVAMGAAGKPGRRTASDVTIATPAPLQAGGHVIVPPNVKRTVAPPVPDRYAAGPVPRHFSKLAPGQYDPDADGTALARGLGKGGR